jgi:N-acetylmuramoyl-L-alanine amidase
LEFALNNTKVFKLCALLLLIVSSLYAAVPLDYVLQKYDITLRGGAYSSRYILKKDGKTCYFGPGLHQIVIGSRSYALSRPPCFSDSRLYVPDDFVSIIKKHLIEAPGGLWQTVTIDPGHGGKDPGAISPRMGIREKDVVLDISITVRDILKRNGVKVYMTRDTDRYIELEDRARLANMTCSNLFVSIHADACPGAPNAEGVTVYYGADWPDSGINVRTRASFLAGHYDLASFLTGTIRKVFTRQEEIFFFALMLLQANREGKKLAAKIADIVSRGLDTENRGARTQNLRVIRRCVCPAVLIEVGYLTCWREERMLAQKEYRKKAGRYIAAAIMSYLKDSVKKR